MTQRKLSLLVFVFSFTSVIILFGTLLLFANHSALPYQKPVPEPVRKSDLHKIVVADDRPLYRFSVIPRGVGSVDELRDRADGDPVVADTFKHFDWPHVRQVKLANDVSAYVTYRKSDVVRWTQRRITIPAGSVAFTDGRITVLGRCGNQVAFSQPQGPSEPLEPTILEDPDPTPVPGEPVRPDPPEFPSSFVSTLEPPTDQPVVIVEPTAPVAWTPFLPGGAVPNAPVDPPAPTPEPQSLFLFGVGALVLAVRAKKLFV